MRNSSYYADLVLDELNIYSVDDLRLLEHIAFARGALVRKGQLHKSEARLVYNKNQSFITISDGCYNLHRKRFSIGHELGHLEMHRFEKSLFACTTENINCWIAQHPNQELEIEANEFAAALLMPERFFKNDCDIDPSTDVVKELSNKYFSTVH